MVSKNLSVCLSVANSSFTETNKNSFQERFESLAALAIFVNLFLTRKKNILDLHLDT